MLWATFLLQEPYVYLQPLLFAVRPGSYRIHKLIYDFLLVINTLLPRILHRFRDIAFPVR